MSEFAIFKTGGKQYRCKVGDTLRVEKLKSDAGEKIEFTEVLMIGDKVGAPLIEGAKITAEIADQVRADKIIVFKKKRRKNYRRTKGHRQHITVIKITGIKG
ncbi:MAG: 50S ribosomal protein L21 [Alphaproteobacteria bacterium]|nr:50S ribosomal protein L21 [Alphaproteobacteria bacterium]